MDITVSEDILQVTKMTQEEIQQEIAVILYQKGKLSLAQASKLSGLYRINFQHLLASREIPIHYDEVDIENDFKVAEKFS